MRCWAGGQRRRSRRTSKGSNWEFMQLNVIGSGGGLVEGTSVMAGWKEKASYMLGALWTLSSS